MPKYVIERSIPGIGKWSASQLAATSRKSRSVLRDIGGEVQWVTSYVTDDKLYCVYISPNPDLIREHARRGGFPCDAVAQVHAMIDPTTAEG
jgi:hypothetical protein